MTTMRAQSLMDHCEAVCDQNAEVVHYTGNMNHADFSSVRDSTPGLGASMAGVASGVDPYESPYAGWYRLVEGIRKEVTAPMLWGLRLEPVIAEALLDEGHVDWIWKAGAIYRSKAHPWMICSPDYYCISPTGDLALVEIKTANHWVGKEWDDGAVPPRVELQATHQMIVTGLRRCLVAVLIDNSDLRCEWVEWNDQLADNLITVEKRFWDGVLTKNPPPIDGQDSTTEALKDQYGNPIEDGVVDLSDDTQAGQQVVSLCGLRKKAKERIAVETINCTMYENLLRQWLGDNTILKVDGIKRATWKPNKNGVRTLRVMDPDEIEEGF